MYVYIVFDCRLLHTLGTESTSIKLNESTVIAPWNVEIYKINNYGRYFRVCGGTLIAPNLVVSGKSYTLHNI